MMHHLKMVGSEDLSCLTAYYRRGRIRILIHPLCFYHLVAAVARNCSISHFKNVTNEKWLLSGHHDSGAVPFTVDAGESDAQ